MIQAGSAGKRMRLGVLGVTACVALAFPALASAANSVSQTGSPSVVKQGNDVTYTITVTNTGSSVEDDTNLSLLTLRSGGEKPAQNPYKSVTPTQGTCQIETSNSSVGTYHAAECPLGALAPGASAQVTAVSTVNESADHMATLVGCFENSLACAPVGGSPGSATVRTLVDAPPVPDGSAKIKVTGLPDGCAERDFKFTVTAKGAKKLKASYSGPRTIEGGPDPDAFEFGGDSLGVAKGSKLKATFPAASLDPAYWEIKIAAKYDGKPKQQKTILLQRCGDPDA